MKITEIENRWIKIGNTSITVKNPKTGKTAGLVTNCTVINRDLAQHRLSEFFKVHTELKQKGIDPRDFFGQLVKVSGTYYVINNVNKPLGAEKLEKCKVANITVLNCEM